MATFKVVSANRQQRLRPDGGTTTVYVAWLETELGASGSVQVPANIWESGTLKAFLEAEAEKLDRAFHLINEG